MGLLQQSQWLKQCLQNNVKRFNSANESPGKRGNNELRRCNEKRRFIYQNRKRCCGFEYHRRRKTGFIRHNRIPERSWWGQNRNTVRRGIQSGCSFCHKDCVLCKGYSWRSGRKKDFQNDHPLHGRETPGSTQTEPWFDRSVRKIRWYVFSDWNSVRGWYVGCHEETVWGRFEEPQWRQGNFLTGKVD